MKGLWLGIGAAAVVAAGAVAGVGALSSERAEARQAPPRVSGPVQGSSFGAPAQKKETPDAESQVPAGPDATPIATPAPVSPAPTPEPAPVQVAAASPAPQAGAD